MRAEKTEPTAKDANGRPKQKRFLLAFVRELCRIVRRGILPHRRDRKIRGIRFLTQSLVPFPRSLVFLRVPSRHSRLSSFLFAVRWPSRERGMRFQCPGWFARPALAAVARPKKSVDRSLWWSRPFAPENHRSTRPRICNQATFSRAIADHQQQFSMSARGICRSNHIARSITGYAGFYSFLGEGPVAWRLDRSAESDPCRGPPSRLLVFHPKRWGLSLARPARCARRPGLLGSGRRHHRDQQGGDHRRGYTHSTVT
jgi:hypothetical protein